MGLGSRNEKGWVPDLNKYWISQKDVKSIVKNRGAFAPVFRCGNNILLKLLSAAKQTFAARLLPFPEFVCPVSTGALSKT